MQLSNVWSPIIDLDGARLVVRRVVCADRRPEELRIHVQRRKMTSRVLVVIFYFLRVLDVKEGCTVLPLF